ncbi:C13 family peptidase [Stutzerimonas kirkiae]|uniref:Peptidase C13 n=1 Tax=Stutzerimonas kirkiae TaxID=2211392 RepID=A0A4Q9R1X2_9GAMM|nr:C13 family peptidase [Stutzerimonas kirkiae]TBU92170.1 peptidase C13 [Stutzerimonas kirkiae]TBV01150.1 peptidase C13 [Stutzerimonas kirkiae]TBV10453.1 peptidase C13 [Stutzerimonas kirkiae]
MRPFIPLFLGCLLVACGESAPLTPTDVVLPDGSRYQGTLADGLLQGEGRLDYPGGSHYQGQFERGLLHGQGLLQYADGSSHQGRFEEGQANGEGLLSDADGTLAGVFRQGLLEGKGHYRSNDGAQYRGAFVNGQFHGQGDYQDENGARWRGEFEDGQLQGQGSYEDEDGNRYQGGFKQWRYHGQGLLQRPDGSRYQGQFRRGRYHGEGTLTLADGTTRSGTWHNGRLALDAQGQRQPDPLELALLRQGTLLQRAIDTLPASTPARELYTLTFAGDGQQSVFLREADYVSDLLATEFAAHGQINLANHRDHLADRPLATRENLRRAIEALAASSGPEDLLFLYFTSHGSSDHRLALEQPRLALEDLSADELAELLRPLAGRPKVVVISACFSGGFIAPLRDDDTLIMTAARADRVSFGCSEESDFTYFGRALFADALRQTDDLKKAFELASAIVAEREQADRFEPSEPQLWAPARVLLRWRLMMKSRSGA